MDKAKVYFTDFRVPVGRNIMQKLRALCLAAGIKKIDMDGKFVAISTRRSSRTSSRSRAACPS